LAADAVERHGLVLVTLAFGFAIICAGARQPYDGPAYTIGLPTKTFSYAVLAAWLICLAVLVYAYASIMTFVGFDEIYEQRAIGGRATTPVMGYVQTYFSNVLSPALIALGLTRRRLSLVGLGTLGCVVMFMISAQRTVLLLPAAIVALYLMLRSESRFARTMVLPLLLLAIAVFIAAMFYEESLVAFFLAQYLNFRTLGIPGLSVSQYYDLFNSHGFTWWSHVKGFDLLISPPRSFADDAWWPQLGLIVGDRVYDAGVAHNANANLFAGDGLAAAGILGLMVISVVCSVWLSLIDRASRGWNPAFATLVVLPVGISLTNGHLFTVLLSFGGLFWILAFHFFKPARV
jgi:hypothetical protein